MSDKKQVKVIKNIGILSVLSNNDAEILKQDVQIKNIGCLVVREDFYTKYPKLTFMNTGSTVVIPKDTEYSLSLGSKTIDNAYLEAINIPLYMIVVGVLIVASDVDADMFIQKLSGINLVGIVVCKKSLQGVINAKLKGQTALTITYDDDDENLSFAMENGDQIIGNNYLKSLKENSVLILNGSTVATELLDKDMFCEKVFKIIVNGSLVVSEENAALIDGYTMINGSKTVIPAGFEYVNKDIEINSNNIKNYSGKKIFSEASITFDESLTEQMILDNSFKLTCQHVICKKELAKSVESLIDDMNTKKIIYDDKLTVNHETRRITAKELMYSKGALHIINHGTLEIEKGMDDDLLFEKISGIHNFGTIKCDQDSYGIVQLKVMVNEGAICGYDDLKPEDEVEEIVLMGNMGSVNL